MTNKFHVTITAICEYFATNTKQEPSQFFRVNGKKRELNGDVSYMNIPKSLK